MIAGIQHLAALVFIAWRHNNHVRDAAQIGEIERPLVRLPVGANDACTVDRKQDRQLLNRHVVNHLIVGALQESGVDRYDRFVAANRQPGGEGDRMLLGDRHVKVLIRILFRKLDHAGAFAHRGGNRHQLAVFGCGFTQPVAEDFGV